MRSKPMLDVWVVQLCLIFAYHHFCLSNGQENSRLCTSPCNQCDFSLVCDPPPPATCIRENIALGKQVSMSSEYTTRDSPSLDDTTYAACLAFDGDRSTVYTGGKTFRRPDCIHTNNGDDEWLQVDLGTNFTVTNITVFRRRYYANNANEIQRLANVIITVDYHKCYQFPADVSGFLEEIPVKCSSPLTGRIVKLSTHNQYLNLCEIEIWVCKRGRYGEMCDGRCHCKNNETCDNYYGTCSKGCDVGYYGSNCSLLCGHCLDMNQCNASGQCLTGCQNGWQKPMCNVCESGFYGPHCTSCGKCRDSQLCNSSSGICPDGCADGYEKPLCSETCKNKTYGRNCSNTCGQCITSASCDVYNGTCVTCEINFKPPFCKDCKIGFYGTNCNKSCGFCKDSQPCNRENGMCLDGCADGYESPECIETCRSKTYGSNCSFPCGRCKNSGRCDVFNGTCVGCDPLFKPPFCTDCVDGYYGTNCTLSCGYCRDLTQCNSFGHCLTGCQNGWQGTMCKEEVKPLDHGTIVGAVIGSIVAVTIIIIVAVFVFRYLRRRKNAGNNNEVAKELDHVRISVKPQATVKPTVMKTPTRNAQNCHDVTGSVYANMAGAQEKNCSEDEIASNPEIVLSDDDVVFEDSKQLYGNDETIYATLKSAKHELDRAQRYLVDQLTSGMLLEEFKKLPKTLRKPHETALLSSNIRKNRFAVIVPYDDNRVVLRDGYSENGATDYVNASFIKGFTSSTRYIAAQGPRDNTAMDFWRMVWQERVQDIVMLTSLKEGGKNKCYEYWPAKETSQEYGPVKVTGIDVQSRAYFIMRTFVLNLDKREEINVTQYHFTSWLDHSVPSVTSLVDFWRFVKSHCASYDSSPLLVHCSAGVGRSGTYIGLDIAMEKVLQKTEINLLEIVDGMRSDRTMMVQTPEQYVFLHKALLEAYTGRDTKLSKDKFDGVISQSISTVTPNRRIDAEFQTVMLMRSVTAGQSHDTAITDDNVMKNRNKEVLPADDHAVYLTEHVPGRNQYINAVYMSTFTKNRGSILTQLPLSSTLVDFWRLVYGTNATRVVSLGSPHDESVIQDFCCFWNGNKGTSQTDPFKVTLNTSTSLGNNLVSYTVNLTKKDTALPREIQVLRYDGWLHDIPDKSDILQLIDTLDTMPAMRGNNPVIIQCIDGGAKSGFFCAIRDIISRVTYDHEVDVYMTVRSVQSVRPEAVTTVEQYRYCYEVAQQKVREMSVYANL